METASHPRPPRQQGESRSTLRILQSVFGIAVLLATLFTAFPSRGLVSGDFYSRLSVILTPRPVEGSAPASQPQLRIGIVAGHAGNDPGAVCVDGNGQVTLTEADVNLKIAAIVQQKLIEAGYQVDLLREFDSRLNGYRALAIVSIHNDSCEYVNDEATGFKVAAALNTTDPNRANRLTACLIDRYQRATNLTFHAGSITSDMREYHAFREIDPSTIAAIIETGFLNLDREILTKQTERVAAGVVDGILCFANNENIEPTPVPGAIP
ncbi:MAG: N-acetylmuramoyl-L-alanine amidase family protein [Chloroflexota bacterium]|nr:N-acetylmuramoyl-L-alanine amidase [Chloroflexota bacterium]MBI5702267.1 N-acetylmuramoyl-L-alanine amidase [Chloroflexota bacterium]